MRMNLMGTSRENPKAMFIANVNHILVYHFSTLTPRDPPTLVNRLLDPRCGNDDADDRTINVLQVGYLGTDEVVVTADEIGDVCVWFTMNLQRDPLLLSVTDSAWGIAIHAEKRLIAISSNAHTVTVFHCGIDGGNSRRWLSGDSETVVDAHPRISAPASTSSVAAGSVEGTSQQILRGHGHNIPTVAFSSCGNFVATASVDRTCRTWRLSDGNQIQEKTLGPLWGWGVCFISKESWTTLSRQQYKQIPKYHLRPGKLPGQNVKDSPFSTTAFTQRRLPIGRDLRMIRSRWYAGPLHDTSCDDLDSDEDEEDLFRQGSRAARQSHNILGGDADVHQDETDAQNASPFGVDIDQIEYEWGDLSSNSSSIADEVQYRDDELEQVASAHRHAATTTLALDADDSSDIGIDGDNEGIDMGTEAVGRGAEEGTSSDPALCYNSEGNRSVAGRAVTTVSEAPGREGSSSDQKHHDSPSTPAEQYSASKATGSRGILGQEQQPQEVINVDSSHIGISIHTEPYVPSPPPQYPMELLACATARNIYLLSRYPSAPDSAKDGIADPSTALQGSISLPPRLYHASDDEDDDDEFGSPNAIHGGPLLAWPDGGDEEMVESEYDPDYDTDPYYEDMDDLMGTADEDEDEDEEDMDDDGSDVDDGGEDDGDHDGDSDEDTDDLSTQNLYRPWRFHVSSQGPAVPSLHTLSVARAAASRADGRRVHYLDHIDRLFVMLLVPELNVLIVASQKGTITIFRLLSVLDDSTTQETKTHGSLDAVGSQFAGREALEAVGVQAAQSHKHEEPRTAAAKRDEVYRNDDESTATVMAQGVKHVLFPEAYLPRLEPPPSPLIGVSVLPLIRRPSGPASTLPVGSFILHLAYVDSQLYSYEIVLGDVEDDGLVDVSSVFV
ncbi:hypothetical protein BG011_002333 [Mortierella polycephala]|uniref:WD40 repeat-like protein n=1 Tax=Mortierella polycephala TaxID=41804 RepID=A0A9P6Q7U0_9FUNG|nr:hypothetical protein BG011_002333 [Mortierella polycephala]